MAEEPKIFTKSQLLEKLTEVAKKQKEKNDAVINQKDNEINDLTTKLNQAIESLNALKTAQEDILNNVNELTNTNKALNEQIAELEQQLKENNSNSTDKYVEFYSMVVKLVSEIDSNNSVNVENTAEDKPAKKTKNSKKKQEVITETDDVDVNAVAVVNVVDTTAENIEVNNCDDDSIDVDALLSDL